MSAISSVGLLRSWKNLDVLQFHEDSQGTQGSRVECNYGLLKSLEILLCQTFARVKMKILDMPVPKT